MENELFRHWRVKPVPVSVNAFSHAALRSFFEIRRYSCKFALRRMKKGVDRNSPTCRFAKFLIECSRRMQLYCRITSDETNDSGNFANVRRYGFDFPMTTARIRDTAEICVRTGKPKFLGFLTAEEAVSVKNTLKNAPCRISLFGGYEGAERVMLGCFPDWCDTADFPIEALTLSYRKGDSLSHRDFLGALMALGIKRETVGDILSEPGRTVVFVTAEIADFVKTQITKIGRVGVTVRRGFNEPLPLGDRPTAFSVTAASERLDCVVSALCGCSRSKSAELINDGLVSLNAAVTMKAVKPVNDGDILTVRGKGKFFIDSLAQRTKKDRIIIEYRKYI